MTNEFADSLVEAVQKLYKSDVSAQKLFDWTAKRSRDATYTTIDRMCSALEISRGDAVALTKKLEHIDCGEFIVGRRGSKSRFAWKFSCISIGQAASGETSNIEPVEIDVADNEDDESETNLSKTNTPNPVSNLTISEAKAGLAQTFGVLPSNIEIVIRG